MQALDWAVIAAYVGALLYLGWRASRGQHSAESHLRANRDLPTWAVVFSILSTEISAATYVSVPEKGYAANWNYMQFAVGALVGKLVLALVVVRLYWRLNLPTAYGFLRQRVGPLSQRASAWAFLVGRLIASGVRLFIAALAFRTVSGLDIRLGVAVLVLVSTVYTMTGGLRAVVWTDVAQGLLLLFGAAAALIYGLAAIDLPLGDLAREAWDAGKLQFLTLEDGGRGWLASDRPWPMAVLAGAGLVLATHGTDQENVQQLLNTRSERESMRSIVASALFTFPVVAIFLATGTMLWLYHRHVEVSAYDPTNTREVFPNFIAHALPTGVRGLALAGLFAAAVSGATLNAAAATWTNDIRPRALDGASALARVRRLDVGFGLCLGLVALFFAWYTEHENKHENLVNIALSAMTIVYGGVLGAFLSALLLKTRGSDASVTAGMIIGALIGAVLFFQREWLGALGLLERFGIEGGGKVLEWQWNIPAAAAAAIGVALLGRRRPVEVAA